MKLFSFLIFIFITISCQPIAMQKNGSRHRKKVKPARSFFKANPLELIKGAVLNSQIQLNDRELSADYYLVNKQVFKSHGNDLEEHFMAAPLPKYHFSQNIKQRVRSLQSGEDGLAFSFVRESKDTLQLQSFKLFNRLAKPLMLHFSKAKNGKSFSLLFLVEQNEQKELWSLVFSQGRKKEHHQSSHYSYLMGRGLEISWQKSKKLYFCADENMMSSQTLKTIEESWMDPQAKSSFSLKRLTRFPPFSDLNVQCIYLVNNFRRNQNRAMITGTTLPIVDWKNSSFLDSDIFIWLSELDRYTFNEKLKKVALNRTIIHEIGHYLGLGHEDRWYTVMAAKLNDPWAEKKPTEQDFEALRALYSKTE